MQKHLDPETGVNKPFENVSWQGRRPSQNFLGREHQFSSLFQAQFFSAELILSNLNIKKNSRGVRDHVPPEKF